MKFHPIPLIVFLLSLAFPATAQMPTQLAVPNSPAYESAANQMRNSPPRQYDFSRAVLSDVLRVMAEDSGISFFGLPEGAAGADRLVTFSVNASPFSAMEILTRANGISLIFENGIFYLRPADDAELVGRIYQIQYNAQEMVRKNEQGSSMGSSGGSSEGGASSIGLNLQGAPNFFVTEPSRLLEDVRGILDIRTTGRVATMAPTASVDNIGQLSVGNLPGQPDVYVRTTTDQNGEPIAAPGSESGQAKVIWNSDSNSLYVVSTRQQHQWIEGYLAAADQPQPLVAIEVKFLEINKDPQRELGIDWTGTLAGGWGATVEGIDGAISSPLNLDRVGDYALPTAILSYDDVNLRLRALFSDRKNRTVSYPRMITLDNREVSFRSVINQPVLSSSASTSIGAGATETNSVEYVPIGTVINILPKRMNNGTVLLNVSITVSDIIGTEVINGNPFPIASSRVYNAPINVDSGYTVAISGLDAAREDKDDQGVPFLGKIPILGYAFKTRGESRSRQHLMMLITPTLLNPNQPGVPERPTIRNPWGNTLPSFDPFADDQLPPEERDFHDKRDAKKKKKNVPPQAPQIPVGPSAHHYPSVAVETVTPADANPVAAPAPAPMETPLPMADVQAEEPEPELEPEVQDEVAVEESREKASAFAKLFGRKNSKSIETGPVAADPKLTQDETRTKTSVFNTKLFGKKADASAEPKVAEAKSRPSSTKAKLFGPAFGKKEESSEEPKLAEAKPRLSTRDPEMFGVISDPEVLAIPVSPSEIAMTDEPVPAPVKEADADPAPAPAFAESKPAVKSSDGIRWDGTKLAGGPDALPGAVSYLEKELMAADEKGDTNEITGLKEETNRLLGYIKSTRMADDALEHIDSLNEGYWALIKLNLQAEAAQREKAPTLVEVVEEP